MCQKSCGTYLICVLGVPPRVMPINNLLERHPILIPFRTTGHSFIVLLHFHQKNLPVLVFQREKHSPAKHEFLSQKLSNRIFQVRTRRDAYSNDPPRSQEPRKTRCGALVLEWFQLDIERRFVVISNETCSLDDLSAIPILLLVEGTAQSETRSDRRVLRDCKLLPIKFCPTNKALGCESL